MEAAHLRESGTESAEMVAQVFDQRWELLFQHGSDLLFTNSFEKHYWFQLYDSWRSGGFWSHNPDFDALGINTS
jgi:hypothetical protein